jgi:glycine C-acetyltransferase/8-amino-7-oxononanoate synthase
LALKYGALLVVDDAHGTGVLGATGRGSLEHAGVDPEGIVQVSTFSKALGGLGGFVAGPGAVVEFLKNRSRPLFYSTGLPPAVLAGNTRALGLVDEEPETRERLLRNAARLRLRLAEAGLSLIPGPSPIVPVMVGEAGRAMEMSRFLMEAGIFCPAIRPPTVPPGQCRLRFSLMAGHTFDQIDLAAALTVEAAGKAGVLQ